MSKKSQGLYPNAPSTAPGGMNEKALVAELTRKHGWSSTDALALSWPEKIEAVIRERRERELEAVPEGWDNAVQPVNPDHYGDYAGENALDHNDTLDTIYDEARDAAAVLTEEDIAALDAIEPFEIAPAPKDTDWPAFGRAMETGEWVDSEDEDGVLDPEALFNEMAQARAEDEAAKPPPLFLGIPGVKDYVFEGHAGAGPSGAERWMNCTMSLSASRAFLETLTPNQQAAFAGANTAARQGTTAHSAAEVEANMVLGRVTAEEVAVTLMELALTPDDEAEAYDDEMGEYIAEYVDLVKSYAQERGDDHVLIESRVEAAIPLTDMHEGEVYVIRGSADLVALPVKSRDQRALVVGDLKYGNGLFVEVDENPQIRLYAIGVLELLADPETGELPDWLDEVVYHIIQPRLGGIRTWSESVDDLLEWRDEVLAPALTKALYGRDEGATYNPSDLACQWCPARGACPALAEVRLDAASDLFGVITEAEYKDGPGAFPETDLLDDERLGSLLLQVANLIDLHKDLKEEAQRRLHRGRDVPGFRLVSYTPKRQWQNLEDAVTAFEDVGLNTAQIAEMFKEPALISPAQAEKVLGKEGYPLIEPLVVKPDKVPLISTGPNDRRKDWEGKPPEQMFPDLGEDES